MPVGAKRRACPSAFMMNGLAADTWGGINSPVAASLKEKSGTSLVTHLEPSQATSTWWDPRAYRWDRPSSGCKRSGGLQARRRTTWGIDRGRSCLPGSPPLAGRYFQFRIFIHIAGIDPDPAGCGPVVLELAKESSREPSATL